MRRISMLLTVACSLAAQSDDSGKRDFQKDLSKQKFNLRASSRLPARVMVAQPPELQQKTCSIPLLRVQPPSKGTITIIEPDLSDSKMPRVQVPAPPCKDWPTE